MLNVGNIFEQQYQYTTGHIKNLPLCPRCLHCYPLNGPTSKLEKELVDFCKQYYPNLIENDRQLLNRTRVRHCNSRIKISHRI